MILDNFWSGIDSREINKALKPEYLQILEPLLTERKSKTPLIDDRFEKSQIYKMIAIPKMCNQSFRKKIFSYLTENELKLISKELKISKKDKKSIIDEILKTPWGLNKNSLKLAKILDIPEFMLNLSEYNNEKKGSAIVYPWFLKYKKFLDPVDKDKINEAFANRSPFKIFKNYQSIAHQETLDKISGGFKRAMLNMPTGTGKTRTAVEIASSYLSKNKNHSVVWIAHTKELLQQASEEFFDVWENLGNRELKIQEVYGGKGDKIKEESSFIATSFQSLNEKSISKIRKSNVGLIIIDEAHMCVADKWNKKIKELIDKTTGTRILGLTATPIREGVVGTNKLIDFFGRGNIIPLRFNSDKLLIDYLIDEGIMAKPKYDPIVYKNEEIGLNEKEVKKIEKEFSEFPKKIIEKISRDGNRNIIITDKLREVLGDHEDTNQILFFGNSIEHSKMISIWLLKNGYSSFHLDGDSDGRSRDAAIKAFRYGKIRVLCNYGVLSMGFDAPKVDCLFITRVTTSEVLHSQMIGRGLRGTKLGGTSSCKIIEMEDNIKNFSEKHKISFENYISSWGDHEE